MTNKSFDYGSCYLLWRRGKCRSKPRIYIDKYEALVAKETPLESKIVRVIGKEAKLRVREKSELSIFPISLSNRARNQRRCKRKLGFNTFLKRFINPANYTKFSDIVGANYVIRNSRV